MVIMLVVNMENVALNILVFIISEIDIYDIHRQKQMKDQEKSKFY